MDFLFLDNEFEWRKFEDMLHCITQKILPETSRRTFNEKRNLLLDQLHHPAFIGMYEIHALREGAHIDVVDTFEQLVLG